MTLLLDKLKLLLCRFCTSKSRKRFIIKPKVIKKVGLLRTYEF